MNLALPGRPAATAGKQFFYAPRTAGVPMHPNSPRRLMFAD